MQDLFFSQNAGWFTFAAIVGTVFFALRLILVSVGHGLDVSTDLDIDPGHSDPTEGFKAISVQGIAAFMMGFGWAGLGALKGTGLSLGVSMGVGVFGGVGMVWLAALLLKCVYDLERSGNINLQSAVGSEGQVYTQIPAGGSGCGQVRITVSGRQRYVKAASEGGEIATGSRVRIVGINGDRSLRVTPA